MISIIIHADYFELRKFCRKLSIAFSKLFETTCGMCYCGLWCGFALVIRRDKIENATAMSIHVRYFRTRVHSNKQAPVRAPTVHLAGSQSYECPRSCRFAFCFYNPEFVRTNRKPAKSDWLTSFSSQWISGPESISCPKIGLWFRSSASHGGRSIEIRWTSEIWRLTQTLRKSSSQLPKKIKS